jgi:hypothetical protein
MATPPVRRPPPGTGGPPPTPPDFEALAQEIENILKNPNANPNKTRALCMKLARIVVRIS